MHNLIALNAKILHAIPLNLRNCEAAKDELCYSEGPLYKELFAVHFNTLSKTLSINSL